MIKLAWKNIWNKPFQAILTTLLFGVGVVMITLVMHGTRQIESQFDRNQAGIDMVVGAKGSPLQLILSSIYHVDNPTGNIKQKDMKLIDGHPFVESVTPISLGDNYRSFRIVGTDESFEALYGLEVAEGKRAEENMEVCLGAAAAKATGRKVGDLFHGAHGLGESIEDHDHHDFKVVGIYGATNSVADQLILTPLESVWHVHAGHENASFAPIEKDDEHEHDHGEEHDHDHGEEHEHGEEADHDHGEEHAHGEDEDHDHGEEHEHGEDVEHDHGEEQDHGEDPEQENGHEHDHEHEVPEGDKEVTALLVKFNSPKAALFIPRMINEQSHLQSASPVFETARLQNILGAGFQLAEILAYVLLSLSALSIFFSLIGNMQKRSFEVAMLRGLGASKGRALMPILFESILISVVGYIVGIVLGHLGLIFVGNIMASNYHYTLDAFLFYPEELYMLGAAVMLGVLAALVPMIIANRKDISESLKSA